MRRLFKFLIPFLLIPSLAYADGASRNFSGVNETVVNADGVSGLTGGVFSGCISLNPDNVTTFQVLQMVASGNSSGLATIHVDIKPGATNSRIGLTGGFTTTTGVWEATDTISTSTNYTFCYQYDHTSTSNTPTFWINGLKRTVSSGISTVTSPSGTPSNTAADTIRLGESVAGTADYDGRLSYSIVSSGTWSDYQALECTYKPAMCVFNNENSWYLFETGTAYDYSGKNAAGTATGTSSSSDGPPVMFGSGLPL